MYYYLFDGENRCVSPRPSEVEIVDVPVGMRACSSEYKYYECMKYVRCTDEGAVYSTQPLAECKAQKTRRLWWMWNKAYVQPDISKGSIMNLYTDKHSLRRLGYVFNLMLIDPSYTREWTLADGTKTTLTIDFMQELYEKLLAKEDEWHEKHALLKSRVDSCATVEEVLSVKW